MFVGYSVTLLYMLDFVSQTEPNSVSSGLLVFIVIKNQFGFINVILFLYFVCLLFLLFFFLSLLINPVPPRLFSSFMLPRIASNLWARLTLD